MLCHDRAAARRHASLVILCWLSAYRDFLFLIFFSVIFDMAVFGMGKIHFARLQFVFGVAQRRQPLQKCHCGLFRRPRQFEVRLPDAVERPTHEVERLQRGGKGIHPHRFNDGKCGRPGEKLAGAFDGMSLEVGFIDADFHFMLPSRWAFVCARRPLSRRSAVPHLQGGSARPL